MGELIRIGAGEDAPGVGATVDTTGAIVTKFGFSDHEVLLNRDGNRGGMHACSHWFGAVREPQHGLARVSEWSPVNSRVPIMNARAGRSEMGVILEWMPDIGSASEGLRHTLEYAIMNRRALRAELCIKNEDGKRVERIAPGFHPYFKVDGETNPNQVMALYKPSEPGEAFIATKINSEAELRGERPTFKEKFILGKNTNYVESDLMTTVTWSDDPSRFICFEPTQAGPSLEVEDGAILLPRGEERRFFVSIRTAAQETGARRLS